MRAASSACVFDTSSSFEPIFFHSFQELVEDDIKPHLLIMQFEGSRNVSQCDHQKRLECVRIESSLKPREREQ